MHMRHSGTTSAGKYAALLMVVLTAWTLLVAPLEQARSQQAAPADAVPAAEAEVPPPGAEPAPPIAVPPAVAQPQAGQVETKPAETSQLWWFIVTSGWIGAVILLLSIYFVSTVGKLFLEMRQKVAAPPELIDELTELLQKREFKEIFAVVKDDTTFISRLLATGIAELPNGLAEARDAMERVGEAVTVEMEKKISMLGARNARTDDRAVRNAQGDDLQFQRDRAERRAAQGQRSRQGYFRGFAADVRGRVFVGAGDLSVRRVP